MHHSSAPSPHSPRTTSLLSQHQQDVGQVCRLYGWHLTAGTLDHQPDSSARPPRSRLQLSGPVILNSTNVYSIYPCSAFYLPQVRVNLPKVSTRPVLEDVLLEQNCFTYWMHSQPYQRMDGWLRFNGILSTKVAVISCLKEFKVY